jgi:hypothetical protein
MRSITIVASGLVALGSALAGGSPAAASAPATLRAHTPTILHVGQIAEQDIAGQPGSEPDTLVEPDIAVSPRDPRIAVAAAHDGRFPDGGAVDISYAWTHDGGQTWHHAAVPGLTKASGNPMWDRASDPVLAFGPDGTVYLSTLVFTLDCPTGVAVSKSTDGGRTFGPPVLAHESDDCAFSDDKNWLIVDNSPRSRHFGRLYQFWTPFLSDADGNETSAPQVVRWSDDKGAHWSDTVVVSETGVFTQGSQPMVLADGTLVDTYFNSGANAGDEGPEAREGDEAAQRGATPAATEGDLVVSAVSRDGGAHWSAETQVTHDAGEGPEGIRCCLFSANIDPVTGLMYAAWDSATPDQVKVASSVDGRHWSAPVVVSRTGTEPVDRVNVDVSAWGGRVFVTYGTRLLDVADGRLIQQQLSTSYDGGRHFGPPLSVGPLSDTKFAAIARGIFPGDYIGSAAGPDRVYLAWARSSQPADPAATFHQVLFGAALRP